MLWICGTTRLAENFNIDELGRLVAENKISFAFNGGNREDLYTHEAFNHGIGDMYCVVIDGKIFLLNNFYLDTLDYNDRKLRLLPFEDFINQKE